MMEMKIKVEAPDLAAAIEKLAAAITPLDPSILTPDMPMPGAVQPPVAAPANPTTAAPVPTMTAPATAPTPSPTPVTSAQYGGQTAAPTNPAPAAMPPQTAPAVPVTAAPAYDLDTISKAGAALVDAGKMEALLALLGRYGVAAVTQLKPEQYGGFVTELRALGAQI